MEWLPTAQSRRLFPLLALFIPLLSACPSGTSQDNVPAQSSAVSVNGVWSGSLDDAVLGNSQARALIVDEHVYLVLGENATELFGSYTTQASQVHASLTGYDQHTGLAYLDSDLTLNGNSNRLDGVMHSEIFAGTSSSGNLALLPAERPVPEISTADQSGPWVSEGHAILGDVSITIDSTLTINGHSTTGCLLNGSPETNLGTGQVQSIDLELSSCGDQDGIHQAWMHFYRDKTLQPQMELIWAPDTDRPVYLHFLPG